MLVRNAHVSLHRIKKIDPVYHYLNVQQRTVKEVGKWKVGGKYDLVAEGVVQDNKSTSAYTWV